jgi:nucleoside-diphosphate-sugar epimerase
MTRTVLVTGSAGTVGSYVTSLAEAAGYRVIATDANGRGVRVPTRGELRTGDLTSTSFVKDVVKGADAIIHTAALLDAIAEPTDLMRVNCDVVQSLYEHGASAGVKRFVQTSTAMVYSLEAKMPLDESSPVEARGAHGESKLAAERFLKRQKDGGPEWTIVRAAPVYGRRGRHFAASLLTIGPLLKLALPVVPEPRGGPRGTMVHAQDVARALVFVLGRADTAGEIFNVSDGDVIALGDRIAETFRAYGLRTIRTGPFPGAFLRYIERTFAAPGAYQGADAAAIVAWKVAVARYGLKPSLRPRFDREALTLLGNDLIVESGKLKKLGFAPKFASFREGWAEVLRWYQAEGWVPRFD